MHSVTNIGSLDLRELIGGNSYTFPMQLNIKGYTFYTCALCDIRANGFLFINTELTTLLIHYYSTCSKPFPYIILVTGYNSQGHSKVIYYIHLTL